MKKLISVVAILSLFSTFALSGIKNIKIDGSLDAVSINLDNSTDLTKTDTSTGANDDLINQTLSRLMLGLSADLTDKVSGKILIYKNDRLWGTDEENVNGVLNNINIANAYITVEDVILDGLNLTVGRQFVGDQKDLLLYIGPLSDYNLSVSALDALKVEYNMDLLSVGLVAGKEIERNSGNTDTDIMALMAATSKLVPGGVVSLMFVNEVVNNPVSDNVDNLQILGLDLKGNIPGVEGLNYKLLYAMNMGQEQKDVKYKGTGLVLGAGYDKELEAGKVNVKAEYALGSGDDDTTADDEDFVSLGSDYRYGEVYGKGLFGGNVGITNQTVIALEAGFVPSAILDGKLGLGLGYYMFSRTKVASGEDSNIGNEIDVKVKYDLTKDVGLGLTYGIFTPGKALESTGKDAANVLAMNLNVKF